MVKNLPAKAGAARDVALLPGSGRSPGGGHGSALQHSCLENPRGQGSLAGCSPWGHRSQPWPSTQAWADKFGCEFQSEGGRGGDGAQRHSLSWDLSPDCPCSRFRLLQREPVFTSCASFLLLQAGGGGGDPPLCSWEILHLPLTCHITSGR